MFFQKLYASFPDFKWNFHVKYDTLQKVWYEELERGIEQDIKVTVGSQEFIFRTVPTTKMGDDLFDD